MDNVVDFSPVGWVPVSQLPERYKIVKSVIYTRMKAVGVKPERISVRAYVTDEQLALLDALHEFIQGGGTTAEFIFFRGLGPEIEN